MKISGKFILKVAGTLTAISLVTAALLGIVNGITADKIAAINEENTKVALSAVVVNEGSDFKKMEVTDAMTAAASANSGKLKEVYEVTFNGETVGYAVKVVAGGSQGDIEMVVGADKDKAVTGVSIVSNAETSGIGSKVMNNDPNSAGTPVLDQFVGMSGAGSLVVGSNVTAISGATVSTKGVTKGVNAALAAVEALG
ncbi:MAG: FMN-binding protein [Clostridiales bacterium]|nr:FMN-binding protein [Clostridiales bacterium]